MIIELEKIPSLKSEIELISRVILSGLCNMFLLCKNTVSRKNNLKKLHVNSDQTIKVEKIVKNWKFCMMTNAFRSLEQFVANKNNAKRK